MLEASVWKAPDLQVPHCHPPWSIPLASSTGARTSQIPPIAQTTQTTAATHVPFLANRLIPLEALLYGAVAELRHPNSPATAYTIRHEALLRGAIVELEALKKSMA